VSQPTTPPSIARGAAIVSLLSIFGFFVQGFHPFAEDGGLYVAGIRMRLDPTLYPGHTEFVLAHLRFSPFAGFVAGLTRATHLPLEWVLLALYLASIWATLFAAWMIASRIASSLAARAAAVALLACWLTMPIAGTSLILLDPYVTARSLSTPLTLFALALALDAVAGSRRGAILCAIASMLAVIHPLMAGYALASVALLVVCARPTPWAPLALGALALAAATCVQALAPPETPQYVQAAMTRHYWFPLQWHWYEQFGLIAPLLLLAALGRRSPNANLRLLARTALWLGLLSLAVAAVFARASLATHLVARFQPLRSFQIVYELMILLLGAWLGERWLRNSLLRWTALLVLLGGIMFFVQRATYPASQHLELPGRQPRNAWSRAFLWIRANTPPDALFALEAHYITRDGEDAQGFRGLAARGVLPDYSKDGGEASITPALASAWAEGQAAQTGLDTASDAVRAARLKPYRVTWVVLRRASATHWNCPYVNEAVKVCTLP
jgi:hypothetical protein